MGRKSSVQRQEPEIRDEINGRMDAGETLDEIVAWLRGNGVTDVSRTALWRWGKQLDRIMAKARRSRMIAEVMTRRLKQAPESRLAQANVESMHGVLMQLIDAAENDETVTIKPAEALALSRSIAALAQAEKANADKIISVEEYAARDAAPEGGETGVIEIAFVEPAAKKTKDSGKSRKNKVKKEEKGKKAQA